MKVSYHPDSLCFNDCIRRGGFDLEKDPEEFHTYTRSMITRYETFNEILMEMEFPDAKEPKIGGYCLKITFPGGFQRAVS